MKNDLISLILSAAIGISGCSTVSKTSPGDAGFLNDKYVIFAHNQVNDDYSMLIDGPIKQNDSGIIEGSVIEEHFEKGKSSKDKYFFSIIDDRGIKRTYLIEGKEAKKWNEKYDVGSRISLPKEGWTEIYINEKN
ncbi:hypothetical protein HYX16_03140 [Candidatus Woesearchaeota archaeon]|nr:hypothetical protein [Candidatus Woesearchaeota archaeon]